MLKSEALAMIAGKVTGCIRCGELAATRTQTVFGEGNPNADILFLGEAAGQMEDITGRPFVGPAGKLLDKMIEACGWSREDIFITNTLKCRPPGNRQPLKEEADNCRQFLNLQLKIIDPKVIICFGTIAAQNLLNIDTPISQIRGKWFEYVKDEVKAKVMCTYHPSYILHIDDASRKKQAKTQVWSDLKEVMRFLNENS